MKKLGRRGRSVARNGRPGAYNGGRLVGWKSERVTG